MKPWLLALQFSSIGFYIAGCVIAGIIGGKWLDEKMHTAPLWLITGMVLGIVIACYGVYNMLKPFLKNDKKDSK